jgi:hypothetical protein
MKWSQNGNFKLSIAICVETRWFKKNRYSPSCVKQQLSVCFSISYFFDAVFNGNVTYMTEPNAELTKQSRASFTSTKRALSFIFCPVRVYFPNNLYSLRARHGSFHCICARRLSPTRTREHFFLMSKESGGVVNRPRVYAAK